DRPAARRVRGGGRRHAAAAPAAVTPNPEPDRRRTTMLKCCRGLLAVLVLAGAARAQDVEPVLKWKFDKPFTQKWTTRAEQTITVYTNRAENKSKEPVKQTQEATLTVTCTPQPPGEDKTVQTVKVKIDAVTVKAQAGGETLEFDSSKPADKKNPLGPVLAKLAGAELTVKLKLPDMTPEVSGLDEALKDVPAEQKALVAPYLDKDALTHLAAASFPALPEKKGASKKAMAEVKAGPLGSYKVETTLTHEGVK